MKLAFIFGDQILNNRLIDFADVWGSPRGLTGSELAYLSFARGLADRGHQVELFIRTSGGPTQWEGCDLRPIEATARIDTSFDAAIAWHEPDMLRGLPAGVLRVVNQQVNDFGYCRPGYDKHVDLYTSPSETHRQHMIRTSGTVASKWVVLPNGCDPDCYIEGDEQRVPGRVVYASSPDRGLHLLLQVWPLIKRRAPHAHLRIFYNIDEWLRWLVPAEHYFSPDHKEVAHRARYIAAALERMKGLGVEKVGSISRAQMVDEWARAEVLAYPCDTIHFTEGFSVTTLEACAAGVYPVVSKVDALGSIYGDILPMIDAPVRAHLDAFGDGVVRALSDKEHRVEVTTRARHFARGITWAGLTRRLETILEDKLRDQRGSAAAAE